MLRNASSSADGSEAGTISIAGYSNTSAPRSSSFLTSRLACDRALVTSTFLPNNGRISNQASASRIPTTSPITRATGAPIPASTPLPTISLIGPVTVRCFAVVPHWTSAAGRSSGTPRDTRASTMSFIPFQPITNTIVPESPASASQLMLESGLFGSSLPVTTVSEVLIPLWVTGIPA